MLFKKHLFNAPSLRHGYGVFSHVDIPANVPIIEMKGDIFTFDTVPEHPATVQIGHDTFLGASGEIDDWFNHSCDPNLAMDCLSNRAILRSVFFIPAGMELTFDYSTTSTENWSTFKMNCTCGSIKCRKTISGLQYLPEELRQDYLKRRMLPAFLAYPGRLG